MAENTNVAEQPETLVFRFKINPAKYAERFGLSLTDDTPDATLTEDSSITCVETEDAETVSYGTQAKQFDPQNSATGCKATLAQCQAKNPMTCRFHGALAITQDISAQVQSAFQAQGQTFSGDIDVKIASVSGGTMTCVANITATAAEKKMVESAMAAFFKLPGVDGDIADIDRVKGEYNSSFEIDMLDPQAKAKWANGQASAAVAAPTTPAAQTGASSIPAPSAAPTQSVTQAPAPATTPVPSQTSSTQQQSAPAQSATQTTAQPAAPAPAATQSPVPTKPKNQKTLRGISKIKDDKKDLANLRSIGGDKTVCDDIEKMIDDKEKAISSMDSMDKTLKSCPQSIQAGYQKVRDALFQKVKDLSDKIDDAIDKEDAAVQAKTAGTISVGDSAATVKSKLMNLKKAGKINFVPKMLDKIDKCVESQVPLIRQRLLNDMPELSNDATWNQLQDLVSKSLAEYLGKCAYRTYLGAGTIMTYFLGTSTYNPSTSLPFNRGYYGVTDMGERGTCCSATIQNHDPFDSNVQSAWDQWRNNRACVTWKKETSAIAYSSQNLGSAGGLSQRNGANGSLITSPSITSLGYRLGYWSGVPHELTSWFRGMLKTGKPDLTLDRAKAKKILSGNADHDECHVFMGNAKHGEHLKHIEAFEFLQKSDADAAVKQYGKLLKDNGIKVLWGSNRTEVPNP